MAEGQSSLLEREAKIRASGVRDVFTPHTPIQHADLFAGRQNEIRNLLSQLGTPGQHALLYGNRGVGKSSLAVVTGLLAGQQGLFKPELVYRFPCDRSSTFEQIVTKPFAIAGGSPPVGDDLGVVSVRLPDLSQMMPSMPTPANVAATMRHVPGLLIVDEADALAQEEKERLADTVKLLSDAKARFKLLVVGIAESGDQLTAAHPSVQRCLAETKLRGMNNAELTGIIATGAPKVGLAFDSEVTRRIVNVSAGYPHFTHLLALKCGEEAIAKDQSIVDASLLTIAMKHAVESAEGTLRRVYNEATQSYNTDAYRQLLVAAAHLEKDVFTNEELRDQYAADTGSEMEQGTLNNYLKQRLLAEDDSRILKRVRKGIYRFTDPRMPSFVLIAHEANQTP